MTIVDVARHAGVSTASASKVLRDAYGVSDAMRDKVHASMDALGYRPHRLARGMRGKTYTIGMLVSDIENPYFSVLTSGAKDVLQEQGYELLIAPGGYSAETQQAMLDALIDHRMDGLILVAPRISAEDLASAAQQIPLVVVGRELADEAFDTVRGDESVGSRLVVDHLVELGHRRIAFVANDEAFAEVGTPENLRLRGFLDAVAAHGLEQDATVIKRPWTIQGGHDVADVLAGTDPRPTAIHAGADVAAVGLLSELWQRGIDVPAELSIASSDNSPIASLGPVSLTSVDQEGLRTGIIAAGLLLERIAGRTESRHELLAPRLLIRSTTGPSPQGA
ncbi:LacI family DNA-binding transcriptional regulator [Agromyces sp. NPDC056523]|uniref:LacI family DNA-binding transcriptional regulator n=1 Tax=Agromyces sp. NPDC056523 TaxID=3345850 RepID=UPI00366B32F2